MKLLIFEHVIGDGNQNLLLRRIKVDIGLTLNTILLNLLQPRYETVSSDFGDSRGSRCFLTDAFVSLADSGGTAEAAGAIGREGRDAELGLLGWPAHL